MTKRELNLENIKICIKRMARYGSLISGQQRGHNLRESVHSIFYLQSVFEWLGKHDDQQEKPNKIWAQTNSN